MSKLINHFPDFISKRVIITRGASDIIIADNRDVYKGSVLKENYKLQRGLVFGSISDSDIANVPKSTKEYFND